VQYEPWMLTLTVFTGHSSSELAEAARNMCQRILATFPSLSGQLFGCLTED
jgi:urate oxidase